LDVKEVGREGGEITNMFPTILHEDAALIAFDKPSGLLIAPDRWDKARANLMQMVHAKFGDHVANVHRLDADTSGVLLCTKDKVALDFVSGQFQGKSARKTYHALCYVPPVAEAMKVGRVARDEAGLLPSEFTVELALGEDEAQPGRMRVFKRRGGKASTTVFRVRERFHDRRGRVFAWVECAPLTGRTHQIRVHLAAAGAPILGDPFYGVPEVDLRLSDLKRGYKGREEEKPLLGRLALHASELTVVHPQTREPVTITAALPREFEVALKYLRRFAGELGHASSMVAS
jgi:23S rRNA pseudouridine1911/1915/1917 synthase